MSLFNLFSRQAKFFRPTPSPAAAAIFEPLESRRLCSVSMLHRSPTIPLPPPAAALPVSIVVIRSTGTASSYDDGNYCGTIVKHPPIGPGPRAAQVFAE